MKDIVRVDLARDAKGGLIAAIPISSFPKNFLFESIVPSQVASAAQSRPILYNPAYEPDLQMIKNAADFKRCFLICILDAARESGIKKGIMLSKMKIFLRLCGKYGASFALCTLAKEEYEMRNSHEFYAIGKMIGLERPGVEYSMSVVERMLKDATAAEMKRQKEKTKPQIKK